MTNEEVIEQIKNIKIFAIKDRWYTNEAMEALNVAIKNIEAWKEVKEEITNNNIADFIAVQSVLDIINKHTKEIAT